MLNGIEISPPALPVSASLYQALASWNEKQVLSGKPIVDDAPELAVLLETWLTNEGWCLSDLQDGSIRAYVCRGLEDLICIFCDDTTA